MDRDDFHDLVDQLEDELPTSVVNRGKQLAKSNAVDILLNSENQLLGLVEGSQRNPYKVGIVWEDEDQNYPGYYLFCGCKFFMQHQVGCKHLVALAECHLKLNGHKDTKLPNWHKRLNQIQQKQPPISAPQIFKAAPEGKLRFLLNLKDPYHQLSMCIAPCLMTEKTDGTRRFKSITVNQIGKETWPAEDRALIERLTGLSLEEDDRFLRYRAEKNFLIPAHAYETILPELLEKERIYLITGGHPTRLMQNLLHQTWEVQLAGSYQKNELIIEGHYQFEDQQRAFTESLQIYDEGLVVWPEGISRLKNPHHKYWVSDFISQGEITIEATQAKSFIASLFELPGLPKLTLPEDLGARIEESPLRIELSMEQNPQYSAFLTTHLFFNYGNYKTFGEDLKNPVYFPETNSILHRDASAEQHALSHLSRLGGKYIPPQWGMEKGEWRFPNASFSMLINELNAEGWTLLWKGKSIRKSSSFSLDVRSSGVDWFDVEGKIKFDEEDISFPELLKAIKHGEHLITLKDGGQGWIPPEIRAQLELLGKMGKAEKNQNALRFHGAQSLILDMLLSQVPDVDWDQKSRGLQQKLRAISSPNPHNPPDTFTGELRHYQKEGLGWLLYLNELGIHGCLADDMGLGKTVQVLALLEFRRLKNSNPSLVIMPKSLIYNWQAEAEKFTPHLRVVALHGSSRPKSLAELPEADLYLSSYPLMIRDAHWLKNKTFDYVILDESQAIKNESTKSHKACRLLKSQHRLTMTGTPVENSLDDLWSQLNFLNPGLLGGIKNQGSLNSSSDGLEKIASALRPFLLRRTKEMVATDLPEKIEETLFCDMLPKQAKAYKELQTYYRNALATSVKTKGLNQSKIMVLEALLRLRQTACHPGLVAADKMHFGSGKLQVMMELLEDILPAGHKVLIFSQFTSFLSIVKTQLDQQNIPYAYLDGQSKDRAGEIDRFQTRPDCPVFLISLKAGGVGLNLTAADYILLLDPWWNPAVEAQAIDRAHRIGQTKKVIAYRIVSKDSIEDKILQLQQQKRDLADAILREENSLLRALSPQDLDFLLGS
jgi:hypothetical protein